MRNLNDGGFVDRAMLNQQIEAILFTEPCDAAGNIQARELVEESVEILIRSGRRGEVRLAAECVIELLSLDLDDLRKAALLSLIVRLTGNQKFDRVATYVLEKRASYVTGRG